MSIGYSACDVPQGKEAGDKAGDVTKARAGAGVKIRAGRARVHSGRGPQKGPAPFVLSYGCTARGSGWGAGCVP